MAERSRPVPRTEGAADTDVELVAAAARGSQSAFRTLYRRHVRPVYWIAHRLLGDGADAEDAVQETFLTAWRRVGTLTLTGDSLLPWLAATCRFTCGNRIRRRDYERRHTDGVVSESFDAGIDVVQQVIDTAYLDAILREILALSAIDQRILRLVAVDGYGYDAAAAELGVSPGVVRNRLSRARQRLRARVETETP